MERRVGNYLIHNESVVPRPEQLRKIASTAMLLAHNAEAFRIPPTKKHLQPVYFWVDAAYHSDDTEFLRTSGRFTRYPSVSVNREDGIEYIDGYQDDWSMRYRELMQLADSKGRWTSGILQEFRFRWTDEEVVLSEGKVYEVPSADRDEIEASYRILNNLGDEKLTDEEYQEIGFMQTARGSRFVTRKDCGHLLGEMRRRRDNLGTDAIIVA